jgi:hypothetical protein
MASINSIKSNIEMIKTYINLLELEGISKPFDFEMKILEKFPEFYGEYPFLVKKLTQRVDLSVLNKMIDQLEQVDAGNISLASVEMNLGSELANQYIYPNIDKQTINQIKKSMGQ